MSTQIQYQAGEFRTYVATRSFSLGLSGSTIQAGSTLEFDGTHVKYGGHQTVALPSLRGAVKARWLVPPESYDPADLSASVPQPAGIRVRSTNGGNPMNPRPETQITVVDAEEQEVGNVTDHANRTREVNANRGRLRAQVVEDQDGVPIRRVSTPAKHFTSLEVAGEAIRRAESVKVQALPGQTREDVLSRMPKEEREAYLAEIRSRQVALAGEEDEAVLQERARNMERLASSGPRRVVGRVGIQKTQHKEGFLLTNEVGNGVDTADLGGTGGDGATTVVEVEGMKFTNTNTGKPRPRAPEPVESETVEIRRKIAKAICPDFPDNYRFEDPLRKKIARIRADFEDRPDIIRAVVAAETDDAVKASFVQEFPEAFS